MKAVAGNPISRTHAKLLVGLLVAGFIFFLPGFASAQAGTVSGTVVDAQTGEPVSGAQVSIEGTRRGSLSGEDGSYEIPGVRPGSYAVVVQRIGYGTARRDNVQIRQGAVATVNFELREQALRLEEVVATGVVDPIAGVKMPFSVGTLNRDEMPVPTTHSALASLQGKVAGASIVRPSGQPGTGVSILLRTPTSIIRNNTPLFVVDGVVLSQTTGGTTLDLESMDIERIEVIKGAAAAALYGSRASAGVVAITTTRGAGLPVGESRITVRSEIGRSTLSRDIPLSQTHFFSMNDAGQFLDEFGSPTQDRNERVVAANRMMDLPYPGEVFDNLGNFYRPGLFATTNVSLGHNTESTNFLVSANNYRERGTIATNDGYERTNVRVNIDHRLSDDLTIGGGIYHNRSFRDDLTGSPFWDLLMTPPDIDLDLRDQDGNFMQQPDPLHFSENPIWRQTTRDNNNRRVRTMANANARFQPLSWLRFHSNLSYDRSDRNYQIYVPAGTPFVSASDDDAASDGRLERALYWSDAFNADLSATVTQRFGDLNARVTARGLMEREEYNRVTADSRDFWVVEVPRMDVGQDQRTTSNNYEIRANGWFLNTGFDYADKYIGDLLVRRDGSSLFGPEARWSTYYRGSLAYRMAQEPWWPFRGITEFKPRYSIGTAGGRPSFSDQYETWSVSSGGSVSKSTLGNRFLAPEHTTEHEIGLDMIFVDRYQLELTYAHQTTQDQIIQIPQPAITGYSNRYENAGTISGYTYEATLQALLHHGRDTRWTSTLVADHSRARITDWQRVCYITSVFVMRCEGMSRANMHGNWFYTSLDELPDWMDSSQFAVNDDGYVVAVGDGTWRDARWGERVQVGDETYEWGWPIRARDEDGNLRVDQIGDGQPDLSLGWVNQFSWRGLDLHTHLHSQIGGDVYNATAQRLYQHWRHSDLDQSAKPAEQRKPIDYYQALYATNNVNSHFVEDGTFVRLRELALTYALSDNQLQRFGLAGLGLDRLSVGLVGRNLFTITNYTGFDPEVNSVAVRDDYFGWPPSRTFTANVEIQF